MEKTKQGADPADKPLTQLKGVNRALQVLEYVAVNPGRAIDLAEGLDLPWATLHRTLQQLEQGGFLQRNPDTNQYSVGPRLWFIGSTYISDHRALELAKPYITRAARIKGVTAQYVERSGGQSTVLFSFCLGETITKASFGYHFPLHAGSKGLVLLAWAPPAFIEDYLSQPLNKLTPNTETDAGRLREALSQIRETGYSVSVADVQLFTGSTAAPVFDSKGRVIASVSLIGKKSQLQDPASREEMVEALLDTTNSISMALGWRP